MGEQPMATNADDAFANFSLNPPKPVGQFRSFTNRSRYKMMASMTASIGTQLGSNTSLSCSSLSGSISNLMDPVKLMSMKEDAHSRKISSEVMKQRLYESVVASPYRRQQRRMSMRPNDYRNLTTSSYYENGSGDSADANSLQYARMVQSMPVTPAQSLATTPSVSPTALKRFRAFQSGAVTPNGQDGVEMSEDGSKGLASLFSPCPRYIPATRGGRLSSMARCGGLDMRLEDMSEAMELGSTENVMKLDPPPKSRMNRFT